MAHLHLHQRDLSRSIDFIYPTLAPTSHDAVGANAFAGRAHGTGLRKVLKDGESIPEIFDDPLVERASHWVLSTSALFSKHLHEDAPLASTDELHRSCQIFGIAYITGFDNYTQFAITSREEMSNEFTAENFRAADSAEARDAHEDWRGE
ncbi:hypothetical protein F5148DRAFT_1374415 [Russula earlei]|uniref:Uncharacterized protein n=1 Tax=Russula earlei TaxID=71964 RepID=A0ACC0UFY1_9AGAM|nr:hypothetical protein F5148DRAFT_1374415 [Russula earlei]